MKQFEPDIDLLETTAILNVLRDKDTAFGGHVKVFENTFTDKAVSPKYMGTGYCSNSTAFMGLFNYLKKTKGVCTVYTTPLGFMSPAYAALANGHEVVFIDTNKEGQWDWHNFVNVEGQSGKDVELSVALPILYGGVSELRQFAAATTFVDAAHCINVSEAWADAYVFSFFPIKPLFMFRGGLAATQNARLREYLLKYRNCGRDAKGNVVQEGNKFYMDNVNATIGHHQFIYKSEKHSAQRARNHSQYLESGLTRYGRFLKHDKNSSHHLCSLILDKGDPNKLREHLYKKDIVAGHRYPILHMQPLFDNHPRVSIGSLPNAEHIDARIITLPVHHHLNESDIQKVCEAVHGYFHNS